MRLVEWIDDQGRKRKSLIRDQDNDQVARDGQGLPQDPPDIDLLDWEDVKRDLHNALADRGLLMFQDVQEQQNGVTVAVLSALRRPVILLYKQEEKEDANK